MTSSAVAQQCGGRVVRGRVYHLEVNALPVKVTDEVLLETAAKDPGTRQSEAEHLDDVRELAAAVVHQVDVAGAAKVICCFRTSSGIHGATNCFSGTWSC